MPPDTRAPWLLTSGATVEALDAARAVFRKQVEAPHGRVIDMAGDSVLAVFDLASGAVAAALAIQEGLAVTARAVSEDRRMRFRIGVLHLGEIIEKPDGTVYGDGVNVAARIKPWPRPAASRSPRTSIAWCTA